VLAAVQLGFAAAAEPAEVLVVLRARVVVGVPDRRAEVREAGTQRRTGTLLLELKLEQRPLRRREADDPFVEIVSRLRRGGLRRR